MKGVIPVNGFFVLFTLLFFMSSVSADFGLAFEPGCDLLGGVCRPIFGRAHGLCGSWERSGFCMVEYQANGQFCCMGVGDPACEGCLSVCELKCGESGSVVSFCRGDGVGANCVCASSASSVCDRVGCGGDSFNMGRLDCGGESLCCAGCELSSCDCSCYVPGETPEAVYGLECDKDCLALYDITGCRKTIDGCTPTYQNPDLEGVIITSQTMHNLIYPFQFGKNDSRKPFSGGSTGEIIYVSTTLYKAPTSTTSTTQATSSTSSTTYTTSSFTYTFFPPTSFIPEPGIGETGYHLIGVLPN